MSDLGGFARTFPYASELVGVFQPLLGWQGSQTRRRGDEEAEGLTRRLLDGVLHDVRAWSYVAADPRRPVRPDVLADVPRPLPWLEGEVGTAITDIVGKFVADNQRLPELEEWQRVVGSTAADTLRLVEDAAPADGVRLADLGVMVLSKKTVPADRLAALGARLLEGTDLAL